MLPVSLLPAWRSSHPPRPPPGQGWAPTHNGHFYPSSLHLCLTSPPAQPSQFLHLSFFVKNIYLFIYLVAWGLRCPPPPPMCNLSSPALGTNPPLHWKMNNSQPLDCQGSPSSIYLVWRNKQELKTVAFPWEQKPWPEAHLSTSPECSVSVFTRPMHPRSRRQTAPGPQRPSLERRPPRFQTP